MFRRLFNFASALSLLLCIATILLWAPHASDAPGETWAVVGRHKYVLTAARGRLQFAVWRRCRVRVPDRQTSEMPYSERLRFASSPEALRLDEGSRLWGHWRGWLMTTYNADGSEGTSQSVKVWWAFAPLIACTFAIPPIGLLLYYLSKWRRQRSRMLRSACLACGYDLRASKDTCPECGTPLAPEMKAPAWKAMGEAGITGSAR